MSATAIAKRYAKALVALGDEEKAVDGFHAALKGVGELFSSSSELVSVLSDPAYSAEAKKGILKEITEKLSLPATVSNFILLLQEKNRLSAFPQILQAFGELADERSGVIRAKVTSAMQITDEQLESIRSALSKSCGGKKIEITLDVDSTLIGGVKTQIGDMIFDGSVKTQLERIEETLQKG